MVQKELDLGKSCILIQNKEDLEESKPTEQNNEQNSKRNEVQNDTYTAKKCREKEFLQNLQAQERVVSVKLSLLKGSGTDQLKEAVLELFHLGEIMDSNELFLTEEHQKVFLRDTIHSLELTKSSIQKGLSEDFYSIDLRNAYSQLGKMIGEEVEDDLVEEIFSRFCLGK